MDTNLTLLSPVDETSVQRRFVCPSDDRGHVPHPLEHLISRIHQDCVPSVVFDRNHQKSVASRHLRGLRERCVVIEARWTRPGLFAIFSMLFHDLRTSQPDPIVCDISCRRLMGFSQVTITFHVFELFHRRIRRRQIANGCIDTKRLTSRYSAAVNRRSS